MLEFLFLEFQKRNLDIDIIGCGGIETGVDVFEHILAGATMVQVGTQLYREGPEVFVRLQNELISILKEKNYNSLSEFRGKLKNNFLINLIFIFLFYNKFI